MEIISKNEEVAMPGFNGKGPMGHGEMTGGGIGLRCRMGRGRGNCFRAVGVSGQGKVLTLSELQQRFNQLQADFEAIKAKSQ